MAATAFVVTALLQIGYPLTSGGGRNLLILAIVGAGATASILHAWVTRGTMTTLLLIAICGGGGFVTELIGVRTGYPFGSYVYGDSLGPRLGGVPVIVGLAWLMMAWPAVVVGERLAVGRIRQALIAGLALSSWDLFLDPQMVANGSWWWDDTSLHLPYVPGVPLSNYAGWLVVATVMTAALGYVLPTWSHTCGAGSRDDTPVFAFYLWTFASSLLAHLVFLGLPGSALWGGLGMGAIATPLCLVLRQQFRTADPSRASAFARLPASSSR
jgi:uncharacterized membrane protein